MSKQCWPSTGRCWCVDIYGETVPGSHVNPGQPPINCCKYTLDLFCLDVNSVFVVSMSVLSIFPVFVRLFYQFLLFIVGQAQVF